MYLYEKLVMGEGMNYEGIPKGINVSKIMQ